MHGLVNRLRIQQENGPLSHSQAEAIWNNFLAQTQEVKRQRANLAWEVLGKQPIQSLDGVSILQRPNIRSELITSTACESDQNNGA
jgi:hypothetical protein